MLLIFAKKEIKMLLSKTEWIISFDANSTRNRNKLNNLVSSYIDIFTKLQLFHLQKKKKKPQKCAISIFISQSKHVTHFHPLFFFPTLHNPETSVRRDTRLDRSPNSFLVHPSPADHPPPLFCNVGQPKIRLDPAPIQSPRGQLD